LDWHERLGVVVFAQVFRFFAESPREELADFFSEHYDKRERNQE
jgi:hypothetical protein